MGQARARDILGYRVAFRTAEPDLDDYLDRLFGAFPEAPEPEHECVIEPSTEYGYHVTVDGDVVGTGDHPESTIAGLITNLNRAVADACEHLLIHAGGVERGGVGVMLPAQMERGKSTLTAGLVRAGFRYLTDEGVAIRRDSLEVVPYPKAISLDPGSWDLFPELEPTEGFGSDDYKKLQWQIPPASIRADAVAGPCAIGVIVFPEYDDDAETRLVPISRAEALVELTKNTWRFNEEARATLDTLAAVVSDTATYRLPNRDLGAAVGAITDLVEQLGHE